jgi:hypothetical protein
MTHTALHHALSLITRVAADTRRAWADTPWPIGPARLSLDVRSRTTVCHPTYLTTVLFVLLLGFVVWLAFGAGTTDAASLLASRSAEVWPVETAFREAVKLWADGRFEVLWERGLRASRYRVSRETFVRGMRHRIVKPTCCWDQIHSVRVDLQTIDEAFVEAQVGVDVKTLGTTVRRRMIVYLRKEEGAWRVTLEDFLTKPEDALSDLRAPW